MPSIDSINPVIFTTHFEMHTVTLVIYALGRPSSSILGHVIVLRTLFWSLCPSASTISGTSSRDHKGTFANAVYNIV